MRADHMPESRMPLTQMMCDSAKPGPKDRKLTDAGGLYLLIRKGGAKLWRFAYRHSGKSKTLSLGRYPEVGLKEARRRRDAAKDALGRGHEPSPNFAQAQNPNSFEMIGREWFRNQESGWSKAYAPRVLSRLEVNIFPEIGHLPIGDIEAPDILAALRKIEDRGAIDSAKRIRQYVGMIFRYAIATGRAARDPAADLKGALKKSPPVQHRKALKAHELPRFFERLGSYDGEEQTRLLLRIAVHTFVRTGELRKATWDEIEGDTWRLPAAHMKMRTEHLVPLSRQVKGLFERLREISVGERIAPVSENTLIYAMYRMGYHGRATVHGFRGTASTILNESGLWSPDAIERQLAHVEGNQIRRAYNSAQYLDERRRMMQWWSDFLEDVETCGGLVYGRI